MIKSHAILKFLVGHLLASGIVSLGTVLVTVVCYFIGLTRSHDSFDTPAAEIPLFLMVMFAALVLAAIASAGSFVISVFLTWLRTKRPFSAWLPVFIIPVLTFLATLPVFGAARGIDFVWTVTGLTFVYFGIYWTLLTSSGALLDFLRKKFSKQTTNEKPTANTPQS